MPLQKASQPVDSKEDRPDESIADETAKLQLQYLAGGDFNAFWQLWESHEKYLYRVCLKQLGGVPEDAEDALSRLMIKLWDSLPRHAGSIKNLRAWLARSASNLCVDIHRERRQAGLTRSIEYLSRDKDHASICSIETPEESVLQEEIKHYLYHRVNELSSELRIPFLLHVLHEIPYGEIATQLAITPETARKRGQLAREVLRDRLDEYESGSRRHLTPWDGSDLDSMLEPSLIDHAARSEARPTRTVALRLVKVVLNSGIERSFYIHLDHKPRKLHPKIKSVTRYTSDHPSGWKKRLELAQLLYEAGQWKRAIEEYQRVLEKQPQLVNVYLDLGNVLDLMENASDSIETYQRALAVAQEPAIRHRIKGLLEFRRGHYQTAIAEFQGATRLEPHHLVHWRHLAIVYLLEDSLMESLACFEEVLRINPDDSASLTHMPYLLRDLGRANAAKHYLDRALTRYDENVLSLKYLIDSRSTRRLIFDGEGKKTLGLIREASLVAPGSPEIQESLATYHLCRGEWKEALDLLLTFARRHPLCPEGWVYYAKALLETGNLGKAIETIKHALRLDSGAWKANLVACEIFSWGESSTELLQLLERMLETFSRRWRVWTQVGLTWIAALKDPSRACDISARGPQLQPGLAEAWFQHSRVLTRAGRYHDAIVSSEVGWKQLPEDEDGSQSVPAAIRLAENYLFLMRGGREQRWIREAICRLPAFIDLNPATGYHWQGKLFELTGEKKAALESYLNALDHHLLYPLRQETESALARLGTPLPRNARSFPVR